MIFRLKILGRKRLLVGLAFKNQVVVIVHAYSLNYSEGWGRKILHIHDFKRSRSLSRVTYILYPLKWPEGTAPAVQGLVLVRP